MQCKPGREDEIAAARLGRQVVRTGGRQLIVLSIPGNVARARVDDAPRAHVHLEVARYARSNPRAVARVRITVPTRVLVVENDRVDGDQCVRQAERRLQHQLKLAVEAHVDGRVLPLQRRRRRCVGAPQLGLVTVDNGEQPEKVDACRAAGQVFEVNAGRLGELNRRRHQLGRLAANPAIARASEQHIASIGRARRRQAIDGILIVERQRNRSPNCATRASGVAPAAHLVELKAARDRLVERLDVARVAHHNVVNGEQL